MTTIKIFQPILPDDNRQVDQVIKNMAERGYKSFGIIKDKVVMIEFRKVVTT